MATSALNHYNFDMSFVISFNGQFRPYKVPNYNPYEKIHKSDTYNKIQKKDSQAKSKITQKKESSESITDNGKKNLQKYQDQIKSQTKNIFPHHAKDIMTSKIIFIESHQTVGEASEILNKYRIHHLPVLNKEGILEGIISDRDLHHPTSDKISKHMSSEVLTCLDTTRIQDIAKIMLHENISALPVINTLHELRGIITKTDLLYFLTRVIHLEELI